jgi:hypothetical protein
MEDYYYKEDNRKPWQKNMVLAYLVLVLFFIADAVQSIPRHIVVFTGNLFRKNPGARKKDRERYHSNNYANSMIWVLLFVRFHSNLVIWLSDFPVSEMSL